MAKFRYIRNHAERLFRQYGYDELLLNIVEHEELFHRTLGDTSEIIQKVQSTQLTHLLLTLVSIPLANVFFQRCCWKEPSPKTRRHSRSRSNVCGKESLQSDSTKEIILHRTNVPLRKASERKTAPILSARS